MTTFIINQCYRPRLLSPFFNGWHERRFFKERSNYSPPSRMRSLFVTSVIVLAEYLSFSSLFQIESVLCRVLPPLFSFNWKFFNQRNRNRSTKCCFPVYNALFDSKPPVKPFGRSRSLSSTFCNFP